MPTFVHDDPEFIRYSICHIEPVKVIMQDLSQAVVKLSCVTDNACSSVHDTLQSVIDRLCGSSEYGVALVKTGGHECSPNAVQNVIYAINLLYPPVCVYDSVQPLVLMILLYKDVS